MIQTEISLLIKEGKDIFKGVVGQKGVINQLKSALLSQRHVIVIGPPGVGKTTLAKSISQVLPERDVVEGCPYHCSPKEPICPECKDNKSKKTKKVSKEELFIRIQGSPDLTVEDLLGDIDPVKALKYGPLSVEAFSPGKIFRANNGILFFDELNRCPEKLQNALLQVLAERKATIGSYTIDIPANFIFISTMNPEDTATEKLSDVLLDRFDVVDMTYPKEIKEEIDIVKENGLKILNVNDKTVNLMVNFVRGLRESKDLEKKPSVRASIGLYERAQANAILRNSKSVVIEDIQDAILSVLSHRIRLKPSLRYLKNPREFVKEELVQFLKTNVGKELAEEEVP